MTRILIPLLLLVSGGAPGTGITPVDARIDAFVEPLVAAGELSGVLLVADEGIVVYERAFGMASYELRVANSPATRFGIASLTKPITQLLAIALIEDGKLSLDDPIARWLPGFPRADRITVEHLLRHRAGIPHRVTEDRHEIEPMTAADLTELAAQARPLFEPGTDSSYSSAGYAVLARVLELAGGDSWEALIERHVLRPAGSVHTVHPSRRQLIERRASSYVHGAHGPINAAPKDLSFLVGAGSLFSTARDLLRIQQHLLNGGFGDLARDNLVTDGGLRWNGITNGYRAFADHHPNTGVTVIFTGNFFTGAADLLRRQIPRIAMGEAVDPLRLPDMTPAAVEPAEQRRIEGIYRLRVDDPSSEEPVHFEGDITHFGDWILIPVGRDRFVSPQDYAVVRVARDEEGHPVALVWGEGPDAPRFPRVGPLPAD